MPCDLLGSQSELGRTKRTMIANDTKQQEITAGWQQPPLDKMHVLYDETRVPYALCTYAYMLYGIDANLWPKCQEDYDLLLFSYDAWELDE